MLSRIKDFLHRHRRKFITTGVVIGGSVFLLKWLQYKLRELQERQAKEIGEKLKRMQHYECTDRTCNQTILGMAPALSDKIVQSLQTDDILTKLRSNPDNKLELWEELRIVAFTRLITLVYGASMLAVTLRVQINILGGYLYKATVEGDNGQQQAIPLEVQTAYLSLIQHFMRDGIDRLIEIIRPNVTIVMQRYKLKQQLTLADTETLLWSIEMALNNEKGNPIEDMASYTLPNPGATLASGDGALNSMFQETLDVLESVESTQVGLANVSIGFSKVMDKLADYYMTSGGPNKNSNSNQNLESIANINAITISLAKLIPIVNGLASKVTLPANGGMVSNGLVPSLPDETDLMSSMVVHFLQSEKLRTLGANVYETFCH
ncbi:peroxisomal biogenesis factor 3 [Anopheles marshallii]|uniref:peroxisomal biogenesis factor 3 n=1 Tax=Anopheles marshallii TaxID=1521116 RepID=UPI00237B5AA8|nr:peroxisomal biogenesis factor 3 [Anopheles marshallii]